MALGQKKSLVKNGMDEAAEFWILYQVKELEDKLEKLRGGVTLVKPEDRKIIEQMFSEKISQWRKRKRIFKDLWDTITENSPKDIKEFKVWLATLLFELMDSAMF